MKDIHQMLKQIDLLVAKTEHDLVELKSLVGQLLTKVAVEPDYLTMPGVTGYFDGTHLVDETGGRHLVPANYAAKSRIVYGDTLKEVEIDGEKIFKLIEKQDRTKIEGVLNKKDGKWYLLSSSGTYKISDTAAEFLAASVSDTARGLVPTTNLSVPFAALDKVYKVTPNDIAIQAVDDEPESKLIEKTLSLTDASAEETIDLTVNSTTPLTADEPLKKKYSKNKATLTEGIEHKVELLPVTTQSSKESDQEALDDGTKSNRYIEDFDLR